MRRLALLAAVCSGVLLGLAAAACGSGDSGGSATVSIATPTPVGARAGAGSGAAVAAATPTAVPAAAKTDPRAPTSGKWIDVDVTQFTVRLMDGSTATMTIGPVAVGAQIDTGIYNSTATGLFHVYSKTAALTYDAPYDTYISNWVGFDPNLDNGFHSFLEDANGKVVDASTGRVSNGCIRTGNSAAIFAFAEIGMPVYVHTWDPGEPVGEIPAVRLSRVLARRAFHARITRMRAIRLKRARGYASHGREPWRFMVGAGGTHPWPSVHSPPSSPA